jgi:hypothetical protein
MNDAARNAGIPVVGHRPINLGLDALLEGRQSLAHIYMLTNLYFWPISSNRPMHAANALALLILLIITLSAGAAALIRRRRMPAHERPPSQTGIRTVGGLLLAAGLLALAIQLDIFVLGRIESPMLLFSLFVVLGLWIAAVTIVALDLTVRTFREPRTPASIRLNATMTSIGGLLLSIALLGFWVPMSWRATDSGIERLARSLHDAGIHVQTTLIAFSILTSGPDQLRLLQADPALDDLAPSIRDAWRRMPIHDAPVVPPMAMDSMKRVTAALHRAGVPLVAGTDALGAPLIVPGVSLHQELRLLTESGLTPYEALRTATINPAVFLGKDKEFGTVSVGKRADLVLVERNPLEDLSTLKRPIGVMVRGQWRPRANIAP